MNEEEFRALKATFPWRQRLFTQPHRQGGIVQVIDSQGAEVPLFTMISLTEFLTARIAAAARPASTVEPQGE